MRKILIFALLLSSLIGRGQSVTISSATNAFVVNGTYYPLNTVQLNVVDDTTLLGMLVIPNKPIVSLRAVSSYLRASGNAFVNRKAIINFYDSFAVSANGGGAYIAIGSPVASAVNNLPLLVNGIGLLSQYATIPWVAIGDSGVKYASQAGLRDTAAAIRASSGGGGGSQTLDQTLQLGNTSNYSGGIHLGNVINEGNDIYNNAVLALESDSSGRLKVSAYDASAFFSVFSESGNAGWEITAPGTSIAADGVNGILLTGLDFAISSSGSAPATVISAGNIAVQNNDGSVYTQMVASDDGTQNFIEMGNALGFFDITLDPTGTTLNMPYPSYASDAAAGIGGLVRGSLFQITGTGIVHVKQ